MYRFHFISILAFISLGLLASGCGDPALRHVTELSGFEEPGPNGDPDDPADENPPSNPQPPVVVGPVPPTVVPPVVVPPVVVPPTTPPTNMPPKVVPPTMPPAMSSCACKKLPGMKTHRVSGSGKSVSLSLSQASIISIAGSFNDVLIEIPEGTTELQLVCLLVHGSYNKVRLKDGANIRDFYFAGSGNMLSTSIEIIPGKTFQRLGGSISGHRSSLEIKGIEPAKCNSIRRKNKSASVSCSL